MTTLVNQVRLGFTGITPAGLVDKGRNCVTMLTGNAAFPTPHPKLLDITAACNALDAANQSYAFTRSKVDKAARDTGFRDLKELLRDLGAYVQSNCQNQVDLIISAGFDVRRNNNPVGQLNPPPNVRATATLYPGRLEVRWDGVRGRTTYKVFMCSGDPLVEANWKLVTITTKNRYTADALESQHTYSFRIVTVGTAGDSSVSEQATAKAA